MVGGEGTSLGGELVGGETSYPDRYFILFAARGGEEDICQNIFRVSINE